MKDGNKSVDAFPPANDFAPTPVCHLMRLHSAVIAARRRHRFLHHAARFHARRLSLCRHRPAQTYRRAQANRLDRTRYPDSRHRRTRQLQRDVSPLRGHRETPDRRRRRDPLLQRPSGRADIRAGRACRASARERFGQPHLRAASPLQPAGSPRPQCEASGADAQAKNPPRSRHRHRTNGPPP